MLSRTFFFFFFRRKKYFHTSRDFNNTYDKWKFNSYPAEINFYPRSKWARTFHPEITKTFPLKRNKPEISSHTTIHLKSRIKFFLSHAVFFPPVSVNNRKLNRVGSRKFLVNKIFHPGHKLKTSRCYNRILSFPRVVQLLGKISREFENIVSIQLLQKIQRNWNIRFYLTLYLMFSIWRSLRI